MPFPTGCCLYLDDRTQVRKKEYLNKNSVNGEPDYCTLQLQSQFVHPRIKENDIILLGFLLNDEAFTEKTQLDYAKQRFMDLLEATLAQTKVDLKFFILLLKNIIF